MKENGYMDDTLNQQDMRQRPASDRPKMPRSQRAKQFAPFDALSGLSERLRQAEEEHRRALEAGGVVHVPDEEEMRRCCGEEGE